VSQETCETKSNSPNSLFNCQRPWLLLQSGRGNSHSPATLSTNFTLNFKRTFRFRARAVSPGSLRRGGFLNELTSIRQLLSASSSGKISSASLAPHGVHLRRGVFLGECHRRVNRYFGRNETFPQPSGISACSLETRFGLCCPWPDASGPRACRHPAVPVPQDRTRAQDVRPAALRPSASHSDSQPGRQPDSQPDSQPGRQPDRKTDRKTDRKAARQTGRRSEIFHKAHGARARRPAQSFDRAEPGPASPPPADDARTVFL
jgi:hypothetical protein